MKSIKEIFKNGQEGMAVDYTGWVKSKRVSKNFAFLMVNDGSCQSDMQAIIDADNPSFAILENSNTGSAVRIKGQLKKSQGKGQDWEVSIDSLELEGGCDLETYPLQKKGHSLEFLREIAHIRGRTNAFGAVFRIHNCLSAAIHEFFQDRGFIWNHSPILTANDAEGAGEMFQVTTLDLDAAAKSGKPIDFSQDFFGKAANLTVSGQLQGEFMAQCFSKIYNFGPTFRAENSNTTRHLAEFWMVEPEVAFFDLEDNMELAEDFLRHCFKRAVEKCEDEIKFLEGLFKNTSFALIKELSEAKFSKITYTEAIEKLQASGKKFEFAPEWGIDLQTEHERYLTDEIFKGPVIVYNYPKDVKAFYMRLNEDGKTVAAMDVLVPRVGEIIGGSQREERLEILEKRMDAMGIHKEGLEWYLDLRRYGSTKHGGFGLGFERLVMYVSGMANIRDAIPCPRYPQSIRF